MNDRLVSCPETTISLLPNCITEPKYVHQVVCLYFIHVYHPNCVQNRWKLNLNIQKIRTGNKAVKNTRNKVQNEGYQTGKEQKKKWTEGMGKWENSIEQYSIV
jgi:hypothetical protein